MALKLSSRFRGALAAGLLGDCYGAVFEFEKRATSSVLNGFFNKRTESDFKAPYLSYTDDTALTISIMRSLIEKKKFDSEDMAVRFVKEYFRDPNRGYGGGVCDLFVALRATDFEDVFGSAKRQFGGSGSYGNGGAMRVAPVSLFCYNKSDDFLIDLARNTARITHSNRLGYNGAILQSLAVHRAMKSTNPLDINEYLQYLSNSMKSIEKFTKNDIVEAGQEEFAYTKSLENVKKLLSKQEPTVDQVEHLLGTGVSANRSVPTAIYVFLRALSPIEGIETDNPIQRTIHYAISLGGDTDTIATMAGSIAGAFHGIEKVPDYLQKHCEKITDVINMADQLQQAMEDTK